MAEIPENNLSSNNEEGQHQDKLFFEDKEKDERWGGRESSERSPRSRSYKEGSPTIEESQNEGNNLHVSNIPKDITEDELRKLFSEHGKVLSVSIPKDPRNGIGRGFGFVKMDTIEEAQKAIQRVQEVYPKYTIQLSKRSKPRASTPGQYLGSDKSRRSHHSSRRYEPIDRYDRHYDRRYREYDDRNDRYDGSYKASYRNYDRSLDRGYDRYHSASGSGSASSSSSSYSRGHYDDYDYHNRPPYDYGYDDRYRGYSVSERDRYYSRFGPYHRAPSGDDHHHHHHSSPGRD